MKGKVIKTVFAVGVIGLAAAYYGAELSRNRELLSHCTLTIDGGQLVLALFFFFAAYFHDIFIWKIFLNKNPGTSNLGIINIVSIMSVSDMLRYLPGRIWGVASQVYLLRNQAITKSEIIYINIICMLGTVSVSAYLLLAYLSWYSGWISSSMTFVVFAGIVALNLLYVLYSSSLLNKLIELVNKFSRLELLPFNCPRSLVFAIQLICLSSAAFAGISGFYLVRGVGLPVDPKDTFALLSTINISWVASSLAFVAPRGLGIREATMLALLHGVVATEIALIFPILFRVMISIVDLLFLLPAVFLYVRHGSLLTDKAG